MVFQGVGGKQTYTYGRAQVKIKLQDKKFVDDFEVVDNKILGEHDIFFGVGFILKYGLILDFAEKKVYNKDISIDLISPSEYKSKSFRPEDKIKTFSKPEISKCHKVEIKCKETCFNLSHLDKESAESISFVLDKFPKVFSELSKDEFPTLQFDSLNTTSPNERIQTKIYRFPQVHKEMVKKEMQKLLDLNVISHSKSSFNSPVWVVPKKEDNDGNRQWRIVIDYRALNKITIPDRYPLPNIADIIDQLGKAKFFSVLDLVSGFHQIELKPEDRHKTAFTVEGSLYEFNRLPFGLINSAPAFQRIMTMVLGGLVGEICFVYIDDIVVYGRNLLEHNRNLELVLARLNFHKLKVKSSKCHFLQKEIRYLGYIISAEGVKMDPKKIEAIRNFVAPKNEREVKSFLGMAGFYRQFIPSFGTIAEPLHHLLRKNVVFEWDESCERAFRQLIDIISLDIVLQYPDFEKLFYLTCDASNHGLGAVLSQKDENSYDRPISFISRSLDDAERNYNTTEKECLAIVWSTEYFKNYLFGRRFIILSDHAPLKWLDSVDDPGARLLRWRLKLNNFDYSIRYTPGKTNYVADELSRNNFRDQEDPYSEEKIIPSVFNIEADLDDGEEDISDEEDEGEDVENTDFAPKSNRKVVTDVDEIYELIKEQHCGPIGGHRGITATTNVLNIYFNIKGLRKKVKDVIKSCEICQKCKIDRQNRKLPMTLTVTSGEPNEKIAFDVVGPFKYPDGRKLYGLTIQDDFTKYILFVGVKDCTAPTIAKALVDNWILYFGIPKLLLSDNGSNLCGDIMTDVASFFNIKRITTSIAHPQSNGGVERAHARLAEFIRATDSEIEESLDWESRLRTASHCYNTTVHSTTGYTPFYLMFGRHPRLITAIGNEVELMKDTYLEAFQKNLKEIWIRARQNIENMKIKEVNRDKQKTNKRTIIDYKVDDEVWVRTEALRGKVNRMENPWTGPLVVLDVKENSLDVRRFRKKYSGINKADVKPFFPGAPPPWVSSG